MEFIERLKNNKLRQDFLEERKQEDGWFVWINQPEVERKFERVDLKDGDEDISFVCELRRTEHFYPSKYVDWFACDYFIIPTELLENVDARRNPFSSYRASKSQCIEKLKDMSKNVKR